MRVLILILCLVALAGCEQQTVDVSLLQERSDGLSYLPNESEPYTGNVTEYYPSGQLNTEISYVDGKENGLTRIWHENGQMDMEVNVVDDRQILLRSWHKNGQMDVDMAYVDGKQNGFARKWYENGQVKTEINYVDGKENGFARGWYENGQLGGELNYANGEIVPKP